MENSVGESGGRAYRERLCGQENSMILLPRSSRRCEDGGLSHPASRCLCGLGCKREGSGKWHQEIMTRDSFSASVLQVGRRLRLEDQQQAGNATLSLCYASLLLHGSFHLTLIG